MWSRRILGAILSLTVLVPAPSSAGAPMYAVSRGLSYQNGQELIVASLALPKGTTLIFLNLHVWGHNITSDAWAPEENRLFMSDFVAFNEQAVVRGVESLDRGTYGFFCRNHIGMRGSITIV
jgi:plastocyanin